MKYEGCLLAVKDIAASKYFYETVLHQTITMDIGVHVSFVGFSLQQQYDELIGVPASSIQTKTHNFQLYFEVEDLDAVYDTLKKNKDIKWLHEMKEFEWGQRDIRIYDPDMHIVEIAENMDVVVKRFLAQGLSIQEVAVRTMFPEAFVAQYTNE